MQLANLARRHPEHRHRRPPARRDPRRKPDRARREQDLGGVAERSTKGGRAAEGATERESPASAGEATKSCHEKEVKGMRTIIEARWFSASASPLLRRGGGLMATRAATPAATRGRRDGGRRYKIYLIPKNIGIPVFTRERGRAGGGGGARRHGRRTTARPRPRRRSRWRSSTPPSAQGYNAIIISAQRPERGRTGAEAGGRRGASRSISYDADVAPDARSSYVSPPIAEVGRRRRRSSGSARRSATRARSRSSRRRRRLRTRTRGSSS